MYVKLSAAALALALAVPALAQSTATISSGIDAASATTSTSAGVVSDAGGPVKALKLRTNIQPVASSEEEGSEAEED